VESANLLAAASRQKYGRNTLIWSYAVEVTDDDNGLMHVSCSDCCHRFSDTEAALLPSSDHTPCPECGGTTRKAHVVALATITAHASVQGVGYTHSKRR
jgi:PHP family Zn ribbon phosphoesterase